MPLSVQQALEKTVKQNEHPSPRQAWISWGIAVSFVILVFGFQTGYAVTNSKMAASLGLTASQIGLIGATYTFFFALFQVFSGSVLDRLGIRSVLPLACAVLTFGIFTFAFSTTVTGFVLAQILVALGASYGFIGAGFTGKLWFSKEKYGIMFAWVQFVASLSAFLTQVVFIQVLERLPWDWVINGYGMMGLFVVLLMVIALNNPPSFQAERWDLAATRRLLQGCLQDLWTTLKQREVRFAMAIGAVSFGVMLCVSIVWGGHLLRSYGMSENQANVAIALSWLGLALGAPFFSWLGRNWHDDVRALGYGLAGQLLLLLVLVGMPIQQIGVAGPVLFLFGFFTGTSMLPFAIAGSAVDVRYIGTSAALVNGSQFLAGAFLVFIPGYLMRHGDTLAVSQTLYVLPLAMLLATLLYVYWRTSRKAA